MSQMHEEFEVGADLDRVVRTALTGVAQLVERVSRSGAERDRAAAQALREQLLVGTHTAQQRHTENVAVSSPRQDEEGPTEGQPDDGLETVPDASTETTPATEAEVYFTGTAAQRYTDQVREAGFNPWNPDNFPEEHQAIRQGLEQYKQAEERGEDPVVELHRNDRGILASVEIRDYDSAAAAHYLRQTPEGPDAARTVAAWEAAMRDVAAHPSDDLPAAAATELNRHSRERHGVDLAATVAATVSDLQANVAADTATVSASTEAARELNAAAIATSPVVLPAYRDNPDRGVSPMKATTPEEAAHRRQSWELARGAWEADADTTLPADPAARQTAWDNLPMPTKTDLFWKQYDTEQARTIPGGQVTSPSAGPPAVAPAAAATERGMAPTKAATAEERARREAAWALAEQRHTAGLPAGTSPEQAKAAWKALEWQERGLRYWTAYDDPSVVAGKTAAATAGEGPTRDRVVELNTQAADYFAAQATPASKGGQYLESRLGADVAKDDRYRLGYAPEGWTNLTNHLRQSGASDDEIVASGLGLRSSRGNVVDAFRDRAVVGIHDEQGSVVGFVGRDLSGAPQAPKYVNTGATAAYTKGDHLLGLHEAPEGASLVRVEGPFDAIATTAAGQGRYAGIAPLGTTLTDTQAGAIASHAQGRIFEALDGDRAGSRATEADFWALSGKGVETRLLPMPADTDPAELWQKNPDALRALLADADNAPTAGLAVIDNTLIELRDGLTDGESPAHEELAAVHDKVAATLSTDADRDHLSRYTTTSVNALLEQADQSRAEGHRLDALDDSAEIAADHAPTPAREGDLEAVADRAVTGREQAAGRAGDLDAQAKIVATDQAMPARYDRGALTAGADVTPEAAQARHVSGAGFSRPTRDMLTDAQQRSGTPARPSTANSQTLGRPRTQRR